MKRILLSLILLVALTASATVTASAKTDTVDAGSVVRAANNYLEAVVFQRMFPEWKGARASHPVMLYTSDGTPVAQTLRVTRGSEELGYIVAGASREVAPIMAVSTGAPPTDNLAALKEIAKSELAADEGLGHHRFLFGGPAMIGVQFDVTGTGGAKRHVYYDLKYKVRVEEFPAPIADAEYRTNAAKNWRKLLDEPIPDMHVMDYGYQDLSVIVYNQRDPGIPESQRGSSCGPTSGAMIMNYWDMTWPNLQSAAEATTPSTLINHLRSDMGTTLAGTSLNAWASGMDIHAYHRGYANFTTPGSMWISAGRDGIWNNMVADLNNYRPVGVMFPLGSSPYSYHWTVARGYQFDDYSRWYHLNDAAGGHGWYDYASTTEINLVFFRP